MFRPSSSSSSFDSAPQTRGGASVKCRGWPVFTLRPDESRWRITGFFIMLTKNWENIKHIYIPQFRAGCGPSSSSSSSSCVSELVPGSSSSSSSVSIVSTGFLKWSGLFPGQQPSQSGFRGQHHVSAVLPDDSLGSSAGHPHLPEPQTEQLEQMLNTVWRGGRALCLCCHSLYYITDVSVSWSSDILTCL